MFFRENNYNQTNNVSSFGICKAPVDKLVSPSVDTELACLGVILLLTHYSHINDLTETCYR